MVTPSAAVARTMPPRCWECRDVGVGEDWQAEFLRNDECHPARWRPEFHPQLEAAGMQRHPFGQADGIFQVWGIERRRWDCTRSVSRSDLQWADQGCPRRILPPFRRSHSSLPVRKKGARFWPRDWLAGAGMRPIRLGGSPAEKGPKAAQFDAMAGSQRFGDGIQHGGDDPLHIPVVKMRIAGRQTCNQFGLDHGARAGEPGTIIVRPVLGRQREPPEKSIFRPSGRV